MDWEFPHPLKKRYIHWQDKQFKKKLEKMIFKNQLKLLKLEKNSNYKTQKKNMFKTMFNPQILRQHPVLEA